MQSSIANWIVKVVLQMYDAVSPLSRKCNIVHKMNSEEFDVKCVVLEKLP